MRLLIVILLVFSDFFSKKIIFHSIELNKLISIVPFFDLTHIHNYGIAFGLFAGILPLWFIILSGLVMVIFLFFWMLINNYVLDFILLHYNQYYWPAFNFADIYISIGIIIIIIQSFNIFKPRLKDINE